MSDPSTPPMSGEDVVHLPYVDADANSDIIETWTAACRCGWVSSWWHNRRAAELAARNHAEKWGIRDAIRDAMRDAMRDANA